MKFILPALFVLLFYACKNDPQAPPPPPISADELPAGFAEFYQRFHADSAYQVAHITFPLEGLPDQANAEDIANGNFRWQAENWKLMRPVDFGMSEYQREIVPLTPTLVLEHIVNPKTNLGMMRRYALLDDEWHLIYYAGMNRLK